jgi:exonuclease VII large subunit
VRTSTSAAVAATTSQQPQQDAGIRQLREQIRENVQAQLEAHREQLQAEQEARQARLEAQREAQQAQREAQQAIREAQQQARDAAQQAREAAQAGVPAPPAPPGEGGITVINKDGKTIRIGPDGQITTTSSSGVPIQFEPKVPHEAVVISIAFFIMLAVIIVGLPIARALARRMDRRTAQPAVPPEITDQLRHLEQAVDTIAIEVERISEGQRFSSGLLREMQPLLRSQSGQPAQGALGERGNGDTR